MTCKARRGRDAPAIPAWPALWYADVGVRCEKVQPPVVKMKSPETTLVTTVPVSKLENRVAN